MLHYCWQFKITEEETIFRLFTCETVWWRSHPTPALVPLRKSQHLSRLKPEMFADDTTVDSMCSRNSVFLRRCKSIPTNAFWTVLPEFANKKSQWWLVRTRSQTTSFRISSEAAKGQSASADPCTVPVPVPGANCTPNHHISCFWNELKLLMSHKVSEITTMQLTLKNKTPFTYQWG